MTSLKGKRATILNEKREGERSFFLLPWVNDFYFYKYIMKLQFIDINIKEKKFKDKL